jgi:hypothetical protein
MEQGEQLRYGPQFERNASNSQTDRFYSIVGQPCRNTRCWKDRQSDRKQKEECIKDSGHQ